MGMVKNVTKRASKAIYDLEAAMDIIRPGVSGEKLNPNTILAALLTIEDAQRMMCLIISQDLKLEEP